MSDINSVEVLLEGAEKSWDSRESRILLNQFDLCTLLFFAFFKCMSMCMYACGCVCVCMRVCV